MDKELSKGIGFYVSEMKRIERECLEMWDRIFKLIEKRKEDERIRKVSTRRKVRKK